MTIELVRGTGYGFGLDARKSESGGFRTYVGNIAPHGGTSCGPPYVRLWDGEELIEKVPVTLGSEPHKYELAVQGDRVTVRIDGSAKITVRDTLNGAAGRVGVWTSGAQIAVTSFEVIYP